MLTDLSINRDFNNESTRFAVDRLAARFHKKLASGALLTQTVAISNFLATNSVVSNTVSIDPYIVDNARLFIRRALERFTLSQLPDSIQCELSIGLLATLCNHGPGSVSGTFLKHPVEKYRSKVSTVTSKASEIYALMRALNPQLRRFDTMANGHRYRIVNFSRLATVAKNDETDRVTMSEAIGNMYVQKGAGMYIEGALRRVGIDISTQADLNNLLAKSGSSRGDVVTVDLKSASDLISPALIQALWPRSWFELFHMIRSPACRINENLPFGPLDVTLRMMSTMGNGFTFPMMTMTLLALIYGIFCKSEPGFRRLKRHEVGVFGDDIIIPTRHYEELLVVLSGAGLLVNKDKSFSTGSFRESCGGDYFDGHDVTPFYVKSLDSDADIYVAINILMKWCSHHRIMLWNTLRVLLKMLPKEHKPLLIPEWEDPSKGLLTMDCARRYRRLERILPVKKVNTSHPMTYALAVGGYLQPHGGKALFTPREDVDVQPEFKVSKSISLPHGWKNGWCPRYRPLGDASWSAHHLSVGLHDS